MYDGERRKSMAAEKSVNQVKNENNALKKKVSDLQDDIADLEDVAANLNQKVKKADQIIEHLEEDHQKVKEDIHIEHQKEKKRIAEQTKMLKDKLDEMEDDLGQKEDELGDLLDELRIKDRELNYQKGRVNVLEKENASRTNYSENGVSEEERDHVIKVLEHESRVYNFEKRVSANLNIEGSEFPQNFVRQGRGGDDFEIRPNAY